MLSLPPLWLVRPILLQQFLLLFPVAVAPDVSIRLVILNPGKLLLTLRREQTIEQGTQQRFLSLPWISQISQGGLLVFANEQKSLSPLILIPKQQGVSQQCDWPFQLLFLYSRQATNILQLLQDLGFSEGPYIIRGEALDGCERVHTGDEQSIICPDPNHPRCLEVQKSAESCIKMQNRRKCIARNSPKRPKRRIKDFSTTIRIDLTIPVDYVGLINFKAANVQVMFTSTQIKGAEKLRVKKRVPNLNSLEAAICNVALFKTMKEKEFRDSIFISYNQEGVILEAQNENEWNRANECIANFIKSKKIEMLTFGYEREVYDTLINGELKQYTKRMKDKGSDDPYPYINLIHYQRLRKSCEFMSKSKYNEPLAQWEKKNKQTPNFAYLVVEPKQRFEEVKRSILGMLKGSNTPILHMEVQPKRFLHLYYNSENSTILQSLYEKKQLEIRVQDSMIFLTIYGDVEIPEAKVRVQSFSKRIQKLKYQIIKQEQIKKSLLLAKQLVRDNTFEEMDQEYRQRYSDNYCFIIYASGEEKQLQKELANISSKPIETQTLLQSVLKYKICEYFQVVFIEPIFTNSSIELESSQVHQVEEVPSQNEKKARPLHVGLINGCQFLLQQFQIQSPEELQNFLIYVQQYQRSSNTFLLRFYGICVNQQCYYTILEYKTHSLFSMHQNGQLIDQIQICHIILQLLHLVNFLHTLQTPRCLGIVRMKEMFVPDGTILPFLYDLEQYSVENDVKQVGELLKRLIKDPNEDIQKLIERMTQANQYDRIGVEEAIAKLETITN